MPSSVFAASLLLLGSAGATPALAASPAAPVVSGPAGADTAADDDAAEDKDALADDALDAALDDDFATEALTADPDLGLMMPVDESLLQPLLPLDRFNEAPGNDLVIPDQAAEGVRYKMQVEGLGAIGLESAFRELSALAAGESKTATAAQVASRANSDRALLGRLLNSEGWYGAQIDSEVSPPESGRMTVRFTVDAGERYRWQKITLDLIPDDKPELGQDFGLAVGQPVRALAVEEAEGALLHRLHSKGYPFAELGARDVVLSQSEPEASYFLTGDIGPEGVFGRVRLADHAPFSDHHANVIARFDPGDPYDTMMVDDLRRALIASQQFGGVAVKPVDSGERDAEGRAITDIEVLGSEGIKRLLAGQLGYSSREGVRAEASWRHRSLLQPEGNFTARAILGTQEQRLGASLAMNNWKQRDRILSFGAEIANLTPPAYSAQTIDINANIGRQSTPIWQKRWIWSLGVGVGASRERPRTDTEAARPHRNFVFVSLPAMIGYDRSDDLLDPTTGYRLKLEVTPEMSREGSRVEHYARMFLDGSAYQPIGDSFVLAARARAGSIVGAGVDNIAPTRRLYAGGGGSVRGFEYQGIGLEGPDGRPTGGRGLAEASIEGRYRFDTLGFVAFVDAGSVTASSTPGLHDVRYGAGIGVRYYSSFGPMRVDIARAINRRPRDPVVALYISIGQAF